MGNLCFTNNFLPPRRIGKKILLRNREKIVLEQVGLGVELFSITDSLPMPSTPIPLSKKFDFDRAGIEIDLEDSPLHFSWIGIPDSNFSSDWICLHSQTKEREREREIIEDSCISRQRRREACRSLLRRMYIQSMKPAFGSAHTTHLPFSSASVSNQSTRYLILYFHKNGFFTHSAVYYDCGKIIKRSPLVQFRIFDQGGGGCRREKESSSGRPANRYDFLELLRKLAVQRLVFEFRDEAILFSGAE